MIARQASCHQILAQQLSRKLCFPHSLVTNPVKIKYIKVSNTVQIVMMLLSIALGTRCKPDQNPQQREPDLLASFNPRPSPCMGNPRESASAVRDHCDRPQMLAEAFSHYFNIADSITHASTTWISHLPIKIGSRILGQAAWSSTTTSIPHGRLADICLDSTFCHAELRPD